MASTNHENKNISTTLTTTTTSSTNSVDHSTSASSPTVNSVQIEPFVAPSTDIDPLSTNIVDDPQCSTLISTSVVGHERSVSSPTDAEVSNGAIPSILSERRNKGKRKIKMQKMENECNLQVTFSKRRAGLFKKANELITLCKCQVVLVIFSPAKKVYTYGHPSVDSVIDSYLVQNVDPNGPKGDLGVPRNPLVVVQPDAANIQNLNEEITSLTKSIREEKNKGDVLHERQRARMVENWWERPLRGMNTIQLSTLLPAFQGLRKNVANHAVQLVRNSLQSLPSSVPYFGYGSVNPNGIGARPSGHYSRGGFRVGYNPWGGQSWHASDSLGTGFRGGFSGNNPGYRRVNINADPLGSNGHCTFRGHEGH